MNVSAPCARYQRLITHLLSINLNEGCQVARMRKAGVRIAHIAKLKWFPDISRDYFIGRELQSVSGCYYVGTKEMPRARNLGRFIRFNRLPCRSGVAVSHAREQL